MTVVQAKIEADKGWRIWWQLTRPHTLTAAFVPVSLGTALAYLEGSINWFVFISMLVASMLIQAATNMFNEYFDFKRGLDHEGSVGIGGAIVRNGVKPKTVLNLAFSFFGIATLLGLYICIQSSWWVAVIGVICMLAGYYYTGGPIPIAYTPFGEIVAGFFMGTVIIVLSFFIQTGNVSTEAFIISIPIAILVGNILLANNIRDLDGDKENGRKTLAILVGRTNAIRVLAAFFGLAYASLIFFILFNSFSLWVLLPLASIPIAVKATKGFIGKSVPLEMYPAMKATAQTNTIFGLLLTIALLLQAFL
ncbi:1,4-dihydroxy-2-naphthoate polyprenyltransferase [Mangrovibacillus cuniculi]|uniref:1,4-dihydroxy-2-naphthoate octaprenyltransferase n=1 Tax=Mangrovibacillus cuniculi TaxID=2593652 RepID=A0A7S8CCI2_9BACI|nr:1,4-dihydroxy-2-naphthoate polyprenyltransferase [Mangrovibacillus cuniculi]QPC47321.1 1,4-dihydroxy-2-naphthoate polyprenyltransferase [Mangrovibacillus cuniculi]